MPRSGAHRHSLPGSRHRGRDVDGRLRAPPVGQRSRLHGTWDAVAAAAKVGLTDDRLVERAREVARQQGTSLDALIRDYLEVLAGQPDGDAILNEFEAMWAEPGHSDGAPFRREDSFR